MTGTALTRLRCQVRFRFLALLWFFLLGMQPLAASASKPMTIMVLGDSISAAYGIQREAGWVALLAERLLDEYPHIRVVNASITGETTGGGLARLPAALAEHHPGIVILELGGNDGLRGYPIPRMRDNLQKMIDLSISVNAVPLLVGMQIPPNYGARYTTAFRDAYTDLAATNKIRLVPFLLDGVALGPGLMQADGVHPTAKAQPAMLDNVWKVLHPLLKSH